MATTTMNAVVLDGPGPAGALQIRKVPVPTPRAGWALIAVKAFGLNRAELHSRLGLADGMTWPRVLGAEATGVIEACPGLAGSRSHPGDAADGEWLVGRRARRQSRSDPSRARWHIIHRNADRSPGQAAGHDRSLHHPKPFESQVAGRHRRRPGGDR